MYKFIAILLLAYTLVVSAANDNESPRTGRSARWDRMLDHTHQKRQVGSGCPNEWKTTHQTCTLGDVTRFDTLGRRNSGLLADVGNQGACGSCWAFASTHAVSDFRSIQARRKLNLLSPQYTSRCTAAPNKYGYGCCGGDTSQAFAHFQSTGTVTDQCLPYTAASSALPPRVKNTNNEAVINAYKKANPLTCPATCADGTFYNPASYQLPAFSATTPNELQIINTLNAGGVVVTTMRTERDDPFFTYNCGVYCAAEPLLENKPNHGVVIVDYGTTDTGYDFWVLKNSWGPRWGESGYFRVRRGNGDLGIGTPHFPVYTPLLSSDSSSEPSNIDVANTCAAEEVSNPQDDTASMSAAEYGLEDLANRQVVQCPSGLQASDLTLSSFRSSTVQTVAGLMVDLIVSANVEGCGMDVTETIEMTVFIDVDGNFTLTYYNINGDSGSNAKVTAASTFGILFMVVVGLLIKN